MECPYCKLIHSDTAIVCDCGYNFRKEIDFSTRNHPEANDIMDGKKDTFRILGSLRFLLFFRPIGSLAIIGVLLWAVSTPYMEFSKYGPLILLGLAGWAVWELVQLSKWATFSVSLSDEGIEARKTFIRWETVESATIHPSSHFKTFIEIRGKNGAIIQIPAGIEQNAFVLAVCQKHLPNLLKEGR